MLSVLFWTTTAVADYLGQFVSDHNLFFGSTLADFYLGPNWGGGYDSGTSYALAQFQSEFLRETDSISDAPVFVDAANGDYHLQPSKPGSPGRGCGFLARPGSGGRWRLPHSGQHLL